MFDRELAAIKAEEAAALGRGSADLGVDDTAAPHTSGGSGSDVAGADGVVPR